MLDASNKGIDPSDAASNAVMPGAPQLSPSVVVIIVLITVVFFLSGFLHLLARCFARSSRQNAAAAAAAGTANSSGSLTTLQGQLQQLFHLHDAGVEQAFIDSLPVFIYRSVRGLKEGADCAVCLNEFAPDDRLRLLPKCSHAFHLECIDTWLLSHSTCPLCRCSLRAESAVNSFNSSSNISSSTAASLAADSIHVSSGPGAAAAAAAAAADQQEPVLQSQEDLVVPVKLGRFCPPSTSHGTGTAGSRRSYSMGSYDYVTAGGALVVIAPTPIHRKVKPSGTPGHRSVLSECIAEEGATPWVTIDIDAAKQPILRQQQSSFVNWTPWKRSSELESNKAITPSETSSIKSFSFRLPFFQDDSATSTQQQQQQQQQHWWWKNAPSASQWDQGSVCSTNVELKSVGSTASSRGSIARKTLRWFMRRDKTPRSTSSMEDVLQRT